MTVAILASGAAQAGQITEPDEPRYPNVISPNLKIISRSYEVPGLLGVIEGVPFLDDSGS